MAVPQTPTIPAASAPPVLKARPTLVLYRELSLETFVRFPSFLCVSSYPDRVALQQGTNKRPLTPRLNFEAHSPYSASRASLVRAYFRGLQHYARVSRLPSDSFRRRRPSNIAARVAAVRWLAPA